ncbi:MAG: hypothetical protein ABL909_10260, partial [Sphingopyxis sp.]
MKVTFYSALLSTCAFTAVPAFAQDATIAEAEAESGDDIVVFGRGETRQVQEIDNEDVTILAPGTSPLKAIE